MIYKLRNSKLLLKASVLDSQGVKLRCHNYDKESKHVFSLTNRSITVKVECENQLAKTMCSVDFSHSHPAGHINM